MNQITSQDRSEMDSPRSRLKRAGRKEGERENRGEGEMLDQNLEAKSQNHEAVDEAQ